MSLDTTARIKLINKSNKNEEYTITCGLVVPYMGDYSQGSLIYNVKRATDMYDFCKNNVGKTFLINGLVGLELECIDGGVPIYPVAYKDASFQIPYNVYYFNLRVKDGNDVKATASNYCLPREFYTGRPLKTGNISEINHIHNILCVEDLTGIIFPCNGMFDNIRIENTIWHIENSRDVGGDYHKIYGAIQTFNIPDGILTIPSSTFNNVQALLDGTWKYVFKEYSTLTNNPDYEDYDKMKVDSEYSYPTLNPSTDEGGDGLQEDDSVDIDIEEVPTILCPFMDLYKMTIADLNQLYLFLTTDDFLTNVKKLFGSPFDAIVSLNAMPIDAEGGTGTISCGGVSTGVNAVKVSNTIVDIDCGSVEVPLYWKSFLDYESTLSLYLPYIGMQQISTEEFIGDIVKVKYRVDLVSGGCVVFVSNSKSIIHQTTGNLAYHLPLSALDYSNMYQSLIGGISSISKGDVVGASQNLMFNSKPSFELKGTFGGNTGYCGNKIPYLIIERPKVSIPKDFNKTVGIKSNITINLSSCKGYTKVRKLFMNNILASDSEKDEIDMLLKEGIII